MWQSFLFCWSQEDKQANMFFWGGVEISKGPGTLFISNLEIRREQIHINVNKNHLLYVVIR